MKNTVPQIPVMEVGLVVVTPAVIKDITVNKKYIIEKIEDDLIILKNDAGQSMAYKSFQFMEADLYFTMCLFSSMITMFKLGSRAYK